MADEKKLRPVQGGRATTRQRKRRDVMKRVVFVPSASGMISLIDAETSYPMLLLKPVEVTVTGDAVGYEALDG